MNRLLNIIVALMVGTTAIAEPLTDNTSKDVTTKATKQKAKAEKKKKNKEANDAQNEVTEAGTIYIYGVAYSPMDSVVYVTDELMLKDAQTYRKSKFLYGREELSKQLKTHLAQKGERDRICSVTFASTVKELDKAYAKQMKKLKKNGFLIKSVGQNEFRFTTIRWE